MVNKLHVAYLLIWPLTNPDILSRIAKLANGCKLVIWFDFDWIIKRVRSSRLVSDMNLIIRDVRGMAEVRLYLCVHTLRHFPLQFTYVAELQRGDHIAVFIRRRIQSFGLCYQCAVIIHLSCGKWLPRLSISMYLTFINKSTVQQLLVRKTYSLRHVCSARKEHQLVMYALNQIFNVLLFTLISTSTLVLTWYQHLFDNP